MSKKAILLAVVFVVLLVYFVSKQDETGAVSGVPVQRNNPLNITGNDAWEGRTNTGAGFVEFSEKKFGTRAALKLLVNYISGKQPGSVCFSAPLNTIEKITGVWSPSVQCGGDARNDPKAYANFVSSQTGISKNRVISPNDKKAIGAILAAMAQIEQGYPCLSPGEIAQAFKIL